MLIHELALQLCVYCMVCTVPRVLLRAAVAEEIAVLGVGDVVLAVADERAHCAHAYAIHHLARVAMVPVLVHELARRRRERAQLQVEHGVFVLEPNRAVNRLSENVQMTLYSFLVTKKPHNGLKYTNALTATSGNRPEHRHYKQWYL